MRSTHHPHNQKLGVLLARNRAAREYQEARERGRRVVMCVLGTAGGIALIAAVLLGSLLIWGPR